MMVVHERILVCVFARCFAHPLVLPSSMQVNGALVTTKARALIGRSFCSVPCTSLHPLAVVLFGGLHATASCWPPVVAGACVAPVVVASCCSLCVISARVVAVPAACVFVKTVWCGRAQWLTVPAVAVTGAVPSRGSTAHSWNVTHAHNTAHNTHTHAHHAHTTQRPPARNHSSLLRISDPIAATAQPAHRRHDVQGQTRQGTTRQIDDRQKLRERQCRCEQRRDASAAAAAAGRASRQFNRSFPSRVVLFI